MSIIWWLVTSIKVHFNTRIFFLQDPQETGTLEEWEWGKIKREETLHFIIFRVLCISSFVKKNN